MWEGLILTVWVVFTAGASWQIWRLGYQQGRDDAGMGTCCGGRGDHHDPEIDMPTPDEWDVIISRILAESAPTPTTPAR